MTQKSEKNGKTERMKLAKRMVKRLGERLGQNWVGKVKRGINGDWAESSTFL